jgi:ABC-type nitrate/sulfonate/bicarbonate transport system substrate-binding protein
MTKSLLGATVVGLVAATSGQASAADLFQLAISQRGSLDSAVAEIGRAAGIFGGSGLDLQVVHTSGGGEPQQAVISRSGDHCRCGRKPCSALAPRSLTAATGPAP